MASRPPDEQWRQQEPRPAEERAVQAEAVREGFLEEAPYWRGFRLRRQ